MNNLIKEIVKFNKEAGLLENGYDDFLESSFQVEEALEGFNLDNLANELRWDKEHDGDLTPKNISRVIVGAANDYENNLTDVDRLDKACDAVVFAVGSMAKLGLNAKEITKALNIVMKANTAKLGCSKDEHGKLLKPDNFPNPEPELRKLLDKV
jgi:predicted HAD superfamily Cof-like phosphohydrolase